MKTSRTGIDLIKKWEGCVLTAYNDPGGVRTIGWGHAYYNGKSPITQQEADQMLEEDLKKFEAKVNEFKDYHWSQNEFDALVSFAYNIGSIRQLTDNGKRSRGQIAEKWTAYCKMAGKRVQGLVDRRKDELKLFLKPPEYQSKADLDTVATEVIRGIWGNGEDRKARLTEAGYDYQKVQDLVNSKMKNQNSNLKSDDQIATEVIQGKWGNGEDRKRRLKEAGYNYDSIQRIVNLRMKK